MTYNILDASKAAHDVLAEREKQRAKWGDAHDDEHTDGALAGAAACLAFGPTESGPMPASPGSRGSSRSTTSTRTSGAASSSPPPSSSRRSNASTAPPLPLPP